MTSYKIGTMSEAFRILTGTAYQYGTVKEATLYEGYCSAVVVDDDGNEFSVSILKKEKKDETV